MTNRKQLALDTWDQCRSLLPKALADNLTVPKSDPALMSKENTLIMKLRVLPRKKAPVNFWSKPWCFYEIGIGEYGRSGFDMYYRVTNRTTGKEAAIAKTGIVCFDYARRKVAAIPESLVRKLKLDKQS